MLQLSSQRCRCICIHSVCASKALNHIIHSGDSGTNKVHVRWGRRVFGLFGWKSKDLVSGYVWCGNERFRFSGRRLVFSHLSLHLLLPLLLFWGKAHDLDLSPRSVRTVLHSKTGELLFLLLVLYIQSAQSKSCSVRRNKKCHHISPG